MPIFMEGYSGTAMSKVAAAVGASKTTLWTYFPSKEALFAAVVDDIIERFGKTLVVELSPEKDIGLTLRTFGSVLVTMLTSEPMLSLFRLVISEARRFPHLAELFFERGPQVGRDRLASYFAELMDRGKLRRGEPVVAVQQYIALCQSGRYQTALLNLACAPPYRVGDLSLDAEIALAVDSFLSAWSANRPKDARDCRFIDPRSA